jgi:dTDP-glucose 4,6-dehydratase
VDNLVTGNIGNISHLKDDPNFDFVEHDVINPICVSGPIDFVYSFASPASPVDYLLLPIETLRAGSEGTLNLLEFARKNEAVFTHASTSEVYGDPTVHPQPEEYWGNVNPNGTRSCYDEAKRYAEALAFAYHRTFNLPIRIVRIFNTYGPRMRVDDGRVVPAFLSQALLGKPITIFGDGNQTRSFCYVSDLVEGIFRLSMSQQTGPINIGNPVERTMLEFAREILKVTGSKSEIVYVPLPTADDPKQRQPDITKAKALLGWTPKVALAEGLLLSIEYFKERLGIALTTVA